MTGLLFVEKELLSFAFVQQMYPYVFAISSDTHSSITHRDRKKGQTDTN